LDGNKNGNTGTKILTAKHDKSCSENLALIRWK